MATQDYNRDSSRPYGEPADIPLIAALEGAGAYPFTTTQAVRAGSALGLTPRHTIKILHRLTTGAWITRIKKGVYAINELVTKLPKAHPFAIGTALVTPSAVTHWLALQHWGLTEQIPAAVTLPSPKTDLPILRRGSRWASSTDRDRGAVHSVLC